MTRVAVRALIAQGALRVEDGNHGNDRPRPDEFVDYGVPFIRAADMSSGMVDFKGAGKINGIAHTRIRKGVGSPGDVILSHKGTVGKVAVAPADSPDFVCSPQTTFWRSLNFDVIDQHYLKFVLLSEDFRRQLDVLKGQTDMAPYVSLTDQRSMNIELPPIAKQRAIAEVLGALDEKIAASLDAVGCADRLAGALTRAAISPETASLGALAQVSLGSSPPGSSYNKTGIGMVFYQGVTDFGFRFPRNRMWTSSPVRTAEPGDTLLSVRAPVGRTNLAAEPTCIGRGLAAVRSRNNRGHTLFHLLRDIPEAWQPFEAEGTIFGSISKSQLDSLQLPVVRQDAEGVLEDRLRALARWVAAATKEAALVGEARDVLVPLMMTGKVTVRAAERAVGEVV